MCAMSLLMACGTPQGGTVFPDVAIDDSFGGGALVRSDGLEVPYRYKVFVDEGTYVVCATAKNVRSSQQRRVLAAFKVTADGKVVLRGLEWARSHPGSGAFAGQLAACRKTAVPAVEGAEIRVELTKTSFSRSRE